MQDSRAAQTHSCIQNLAVVVVVTPARFLSLTKLARWNNIRSFLSSLPAALLPRSSPAMDMDSSMDLRLEETKDAYMSSAENQLTEEEDVDNSDTENEPKNAGEFMR